MGETPAQHSALDEPQPLVLVIDDSVDVHRVLSARLRGEEYRLRCVERGEAGLAVCGEEPAPALILLDLDMPEMDGFEVLRRLKDNPATVSIPVIVVSGLEDMQDKVTAFDLGAMDYVTKPFQLPELRARIRSALRLSRMFTLLAQRAQIDGLTGLWNRAFFDARWAEEVAGAQRHGRALSLAVLDVDRFKSINDTFGHPAGDAVIQSVATTVARAARQTDVACRYGGEEFVLVLPETAPGDAERVCERIRQMVAETRFPRHPERGVTLSAGIAGASAGVDVSSSAWLEAADRALYTAKKGGRDRIVTTDLSGSGMRLAG